MIKLIGILEPGWNHKLEIRAWRQIAGAYDTDLVLVPRDVGTIEAALEAASGHRVFLIPPGRTELGTELKDYEAPEGDVVFIFGCAGNNLTSHLNEDDTVVQLTTPKDCDMFAVSVAGTILYEHRQQNNH